MENRDPTMKSVSDIFVVALPKTSGGDMDSVHFNAIQLVQFNSSILQFNISSCNVYGIYSIFVFSCFLKNQSSPMKIKKIQI